MSDLETALLSWTQKSIKSTSSLSISSLADSRIILSLVQKIPEMPRIQFTPINKQSSVQTHFKNIKNIVSSLQLFYKKVLKCSLPDGLPSVNCLQISKGKDKEGALALLTICLFACINSQKKQEYITKILQLPEDLQRELMMLIQQKSLHALENSDKIEQQAEGIQKSKVNELYFKIQSLSSQNQSLSSQLMAQTNQKQKLKQLIKSLEEDKKKLKRQLDEKIIYIQHKEQQQYEQQSSQKVIEDSNEQIIDRLKKQIIDQQKKHLEQKSQLKEDIQNLKQKLIVYQQKISELESQDLVMSSNRKVSHQDCVSINEHKNITLKLQMKLKSLEQKETQLQRQILRSKYEYDELNRKLKKQQQEKENIKVQYQKVSSVKSQLISQKDAQKLKYSILQAVRDKLKQKLASEEQKK